MSKAMPGQDTRTPFRRGRRLAPRRRRRLLTRLAWPLLLALLCTGGPLAAAYWIATSPSFQVAEVAVAAEQRVSSTWAEERLSSLLGRHILTVGLPEVEAALSTHVWVRGVEVAKRLPSTLEVRVVEKLPVALLRSGPELLYLDGLGEPIASYDATFGDGDYVVIDVPSNDSLRIREALQLAESWSLAAGPWADGLSEVIAVDRTSFGIVVAGVDYLLLIDRASVARVRELQRLLPDINRRLPNLRTADLRFAGQFVFQPDTQVPTEG